MARSLSSIENSVTSAPLFRRIDAWRTTTLTPPLTWVEGRTNATPIGNREPMTFANDTAVEDVTFYS